ncbi:prepilin-type N-terminal cleavage/methylation domain-containing protein, partial [bacterium]|nr:prepilin-type N-terminal cleavage/methylation domain-containing protein [bacterium]
MKRGGFTLIELLIVVAIIGILAAIAVPNFMNAQVRAKLSRVKADMQAMSTANEMYTVDNGRCTLGSLEGRNLGIWGDDTRVALNRLTSPIPYTSTVPDDPFAVTSYGLAPDLGAIRYTFTYNTTVNPE